MTEDLGCHSLLVDTGLYRPGHTACYVIDDAAELAIVDTGTEHSVPRVLDAISASGATPDQVRYIIPTHVHLDHAGGAGHLMRICPDATLVVHPRGQPHMVDPGRLRAGATAVYGEAAFRRDFGTLQGVPEERTLAAADAAVIELGSRRLTILHTPGHANHHICVFDHASAYLYTGDTFGLGYRELWARQIPLLLATTTPVAFDPEAWYASLDRLMALEPSACCLTHFGKIDAPTDLVDQLRTSIGDHVSIALTEEARDPDGRPQRLRDAVESLLIGAALAHTGLTPDRLRPILDADIDLNAQGLGVWLARRAKTRD